MSEDWSWICDTILLDSRQFCLLGVKSLGVAFALRTMSLWVIAGWSNNVNNTVYLPNFPAWLRKNTKNVWESSILHMKATFIPCYWCESPQRIPPGGRHNHSYPPGFLGKTLIVINNGDKTLTGYISYICETCRNGKSSQCRNAISEASWQKNAGKNAEKKASYECSTADDKRKWRRKIDCKILFADSAF